MSDQKREPNGKWHMELGLLRWAAIVLPILFLGLLEVLRHTVLVEQLDSTEGLTVVLAVIVIAVVVFAYTIFGFISRLQHRIIEQNRQLSALNAIAKAAAGKLTLDALLSESLDHIMPNLEADAGLICIVDQEEQEHSAACYRGFSSEVVDKMKRAKLENYPIAQRVVSTGRPVIRERLLDDPNVSEANRRAGFKSAISAPLMAEGEVNGILAIATKKERKFSDSDQAFLEGIGGQLGMAIRNATLYEQAQLQNRELGALLAVGKVVTSSFDLDELLSAALVVALVVACSSSATPTATTVPATATSTPPPTVTAAPTATASAEPTATTAGSSGDTLLAEGKLIFEETAGGTGCAFCHGLDGKGNGPAGLDAPANRGASEQMVRGALGGGVDAMSYIKLTSTEITAVVAYLQWLATQP